MASTASGKSSKVVDFLINLENTKSEDETLCIDTALSMVEKFTKVFEFKNLKSWMGSFDKIADDEFKLHHFHIKLTGKEPPFKYHVEAAKRAGRVAKDRSVAVLTHAFVIVNHGDDWFLCDSWQGIHKIKCRQRTFKDLKKALNSIQNKFEVGKYTDADALLNFFDNQDQTRWKEDIEQLEDDGEWTQKYDTIFKDNPSHYDLKLDVNILEFSA